MKSIAFLLASVLAMTGCAVSQNRPSREEFSETANEAIRQTLECGKRNISSIDDLRSDAMTIALSLSSACNREYQYATEAIGNTLDNDAQRRMFRQKRNQSMERAENFLPVVLWYRKRSAQ